MEISQLTWYIALLAGGLLLIVAEVFIPGGIAGVIGAGALLGAMALGLATFPSPWGFSRPLPSSCSAASACCCGCSLPAHAHRQAHHPATDGAAYKSAAAPAESLIGATGEAVTALRPGGIALIGGKRYDVLADGGEWIAAGAAHPRLRHPRQQPHRPRRQLSA
jgi:membrane-bound serine protease (ClpP class)